MPRHLGKPFSGARPHLPPSLPTPTCAVVDAEAQGPTASRAGGRAGVVPCTRPAPCAAV